MAFPTILFGSDGEQYSTYAEERWPLGTQLVLQDGRKYRFGEAGGSTLVVGNILQGAANVSNDQNRAGIAAAIGSLAPTLTTGGAVTANFYAEGFWNNSVTPGGGESYRINSHPAGTTATVYTLAQGNSLRTAITTTTRVDLVQHPFKTLIQAIATTATGPIVGVAVSAPLTTVFCWAQTAGVASVLTEATTVPVAGRGFSATAITAGAGGQALHNATTADFLNIGTTMRASATNAWSDVLLTLDA